MSQSAEGFIQTIDCGGMISSTRFNELERILTDAVEEGASVTVGGTRWRHAYLEEGAYFGPTIVGDVEPNMEIAQTECECSSLESRDYKFTLYSIRTRGFVAQIRYN